MKKRIIATALCTALLLPMLLSLSACGKKDADRKPDAGLRANSGSVNLMAPVQANPVQTNPDSLQTCLLYTSRCV